MLDTRLRGHAGLGAYVEGLASALLRAGRKLVQVSGSAPIYSAAEQLWYARVAGRWRGAVFHAPHYNLPLRWPGPLVVTVHDLAHLRCRQASRHPGAWFYAAVMLRYLARRADAVICVSDYTRRDLLSFAPDLQGRCHVVANGVCASAPLPGSGEVAEVLRRHGLTAGYILYLGSVRPHKNIDTLIAAHARLPAPRPDLVLTGRDQMPPAWRGRAAPGVKLLGHVRDRDRDALYIGARVFCFPSLFEGFGLPPLEAMGCGTPVVCSNATALPEVVGDAALLADPRSAASIGRAMERLLYDDSLRNRLTALGKERVKRFTWEGAAEATAGVYREAAAYYSCKAASSRLRLPR